MQIEEIPVEGYERVVSAVLGAGGPRAIVAIHSVARGPAAGGLRFRPYPDRAAALDDVLRLARGMSYKNAAADLALGGGKAVILGDPAADKTPAVLAAFGDLLNRLDGQYWTAEDMGMTPADMEAIAHVSPFVAGRMAGPHASGDPSPVTARGVFEGLRLTAARALGPGLAGRRVAVQGLGHVGWHLAQHLADAGVELIVADTDRCRTDRAEAEVGAKIAVPDAVLRSEVDILAPCAIGGVLNAKTIPNLRAKVVAGAANNQLATEADADGLHNAGILYAPDYVLNSGGIINVAAEILQIEDRAAFVEAKLAAMLAMLGEIFDAAEAKDQSPARVADHVVEARL